MKIGLVGGTYEQTSLPFDAQRSINLYAVGDPEGKETAALYGTAGLELFATAGAGSIRGSFLSSNGRAFFVSGTGLYEVDSAGVSTLIGSLLTSTGTVTFAEGTTQMAVCDANDLYSLTYSTNSFGKVTDPSLPASVGSVANIDGYFIVNENDSGRFFISSIDDVTQWDALDFATTESNPDKLLRPINAVGQLWLFGDKTTEIWTNTGAAAFPFARISGAIMEAGILAPNSALEIANTVMWLGADEFGSGIVYRANGFTPERVSTTPIEKRIQESTLKEDIYAWAYQEQGHTFYVLSGGGLETSLVFDLTTGLWHERAFLNGDGDFEQHLGSCHIFAFDKHLVGDRRNGNIYEMSLSNYSDNGEEIARERVYTHIIDESRRVRYNSLEIGFETGVGLQAGNGSDPIVSMQLSKDGAKTWSDWFNTSIGEVGKYQTKARFRRLGIAEQMTFKIRISDKVKVAIIGSYLK
jgi:hypothetical protein